MYNDVSPNGYQSPLLARVPKKQEGNYERERADTLAQLPLIKAVLTRLDRTISKTDSIKEAMSLAKKHEISIENALIT